MSYHPSPELKLAHTLSWWLASELGRRHSPVLVHNEHDGVHDSLFVNRPPTESDQHVRITRSSSLVAQLMHMGSATELLKHLERNAGWTSPQATPPTNRYSINLRVIARIITSLMYEKATWDVETAWSENWSGAEARVHNPFLDTFPLARRALDNASSMGSFGEPETQFLGLHSEERYVAVFDSRGTVFTSYGQIDLYRTYRDNGNSITRTIGIALGPLLP